jgi:ribose transport system permease protein
MSETLQTARGSRTSTRRASWSALLLRQEATLLVVIFLIGLFAYLRNPVFTSQGNLTDIARATVVYFVMACGASLLMIGGGLDFSVGSIFTLGGITVAWMLTHGVPWPIAIAVAVATGVGAGVVNDLVIVYLHVPPIIATLGTFFVISGLCIQITGGEDILPLPATFQTLGQGDVGGVPYICIYAAAIGVLFWFLLEQTRFGVNVRALGGNRQAAIGNGLHIGRLDLALYVLAGATAAFAGVIYASRVGSGQVAAGGPSTTLEVVTAVLIGGTSLLGGLGSITGVLVGAVLLSEIDNALVIAAVPPQYNSMIVGSILIAAVAADHLRRKRLYRR